MGTIYIKIFVNEELSCRKEEGNISDPYTVAFIKSGVIIGYVPCQIPAACNREEVLLYAQLQIHDVIPATCPWTRLRVA